MKTSLDHLPEYKRAELARIVEIIRAAGKPEIIILFGSHARGDWVEDRRIEGNYLTEYRSDYDIYALVRLARHCDRLLLDDKLQNRLDAASRTPVSLIADTVKHFNESLERGRYFYVDIHREGIILHDSGRYRISAPRQLSREEQLEEATTNYEYWFERAEDFFAAYQAMFEQGRNKISAFNLHQTVEHCTTTILLVLTGYTPKGHDIAKRIKQCAAVDRRFGNIFPLSTPDDRRRFELLRTAYIGARYKKGFAISRDDLEHLARHARALLALTHAVCSERLELLRN